MDKYACRRFDIQTEEAIDVEVLEATPFNYSGLAGEVVYETSESTLKSVTHQVSFWLNSNR